MVTHAAEDAPKVVEALIAHKAVRRVNFTGSTRVGRIIAEIAARHLKPVLLELGGKAPLIVLDDADLDAAVNAAAFGAFFNQGQICMSTERVIADEAVADTFVQKFASKARSLPAGNPRAGNVALGSMVSKQSVACVDGLIQDAVNKGADLIAGGLIDGTIMDAHILDRVTPAMSIYQDESFGPVTCVIRVKGDEEAIRVANDTEYGLSAAVFSRDIARAMRSPSASIPASATSTVQRCTMRPRCRSAASRAPATAVSAARQGSPSSRSCAGSRLRQGRSTTRSDCSLGAFASTHRKHCAADRTGARANEKQRLTHTQEGKTRWPQQ